VRLDLRAHADLRLDAADVGSGEAEARAATRASSFVDRDAPTPNGRGLRARDCGVVLDRRQRFSDRPALLNLRAPEPHARLRVRLGPLRTPLLDRATLRHGRAALGLLVFRHEAS